MSDKETSISVLLIGPISERVGGATTLFRLLLDDLAEAGDIRISTLSTYPKCLDSGRTSIVSNVVRLLYLTARILLSPLRHDICSIHMSSPGVLLAGPLLCLSARMRGSRVTLRIFGGRVFSDYCSASWLARMLFARTIRASDAVLVETKKARDGFAALGFGNIIWYPNGRHKPASPVQFLTSRKLVSRFVFISRVVPEKGILELLEASDQLPAGAVVHVYGPVDASISDAVLSGHRGEYKGCLKPQEVSSVLGQYDALVLPTYWPEGYPGIIIEALLLGMPVIATPIGGIPEILDESCGVLIPPRNSRALAQAMVQLMNDSEFYRALSRGAIERSSLFDQRLLTAKFKEICRAIHCRSIVTDSGT